ncbi:MAG: hypothetical protein ACRDSJ_17140, partial [Rubrobacteraceae bacterium]
MARKVMVWREDGTRPVLTEVLADDEFQLQEIVKDTPDLLPVDEFEADGPLMVVGRETTLPSGAPDLLCLDRSGNLFIVEFKTGPRNSDFRRVLAQLLDYGSDLWRMSHREFESTVAGRYFSSDHCRDDLLRGKDSLDDAARAFWPKFLEEEAEPFRDNLSQRLSVGAFHYLIVAQRFTPGMERTIEYLNAAMSEARFYAVELVRFAADGLSAFEARTVFKPESSNASSRREAPVDEARFLERIEDGEYREALRYLLEVCRGLDLRFSWGTAGVSIRLPISDSSRPRSVGWLFP